MHFWATKCSLATIRNQRDRIRAPGGNLGTEKVFIFKFEVIHGI